MNLPQDQHNAGIHFYRWDDQDITIRIDRLHNGREDALTGEITVRYLTMNTHLHQARLNITSTSARDILIRHLIAKESLIEWPSIIEQACVLTLRSHRMGEPIKWFGEQPPASLQPNYILTPILLHNKVNLLYGAGGIGKSTLAIYWAVLISENIEENGLTPQPGKVLYLDYETDEDDFEVRLHGIRKGFGQEGTAGGVAYRRCWEPLNQDIEAIRALVAENDISFVIIDSVGLACGGEPENAGAVLEYFRALRSLNISSLSIDHIVKNQMGKTSNPFGSVYKRNTARQMFELRGSQEENSTHLALIHQKANTVARMKPMGFKVDYEDDLIGVSSEDLRNVPELHGALNVRDQIAGQLLQGKKKVKELSEILELPVNTIAITLSRGSGKTFTKLGDGFWGALQPLQ